MSKLWPRCRGALAGVGLLFALVTGTPAVRWMGAALAGEWGSAGGETLIVLSGSSLESGILGESSYWRSVYAVLFWRQERYRTIWITGQGDVPAQMRQFLVGQGVPEAAIRLDSGSVNTAASARNMATLLKGEPGRKVLLTSDYHMFRSRRMFARAGLAVATLPVPDAQKRASLIRARWGAFCDLAEELVKIVWYGGQGAL